jgi:hypothetical protein
MPYKIKKSGSGYKVCKKFGKSKCFSKKLLSKKKAQAQMRAIGMHGESFKDYFNQTKNK